MSDIFISYSQEDREKARMLAGALQQEGWSVWWDRKIPPGKTFDEVIERELDAARCVIVLWSRVSVTSKWVKVEASEGNRRGILIPAFVADDARIPLEFRYQHAPSLTGWTGQTEDAEYGALKEAVGQLLGNATRVQSDTASARKRAEPGRQQRADFKIEAANQRDYWRQKLLLTMRPWGTGLVIAGLVTLLALYESGLGVKVYQSRPPTSQQGSAVQPSTMADANQTKSADKNPPRSPDEMSTSSSGKAAAVTPTTGPERKDTPPGVSEPKSPHKDTSARTSKGSIGDQTTGDLKGNRGDAPTGTPTNALPDSIVNDLATGLMWTKDDNGKDVNWPGAEQYCKTLSLGGYSDWGLPTIDELAQLYDNDVSTIRRPFRLTSDEVWSSKRSVDFVKQFDFKSYGRGGIANAIRRTPFVPLDHMGRVLCVRR